MTDYTGSNTPADQRDLWRTPPALFASLDAEFYFQLDAAAAPHNALCRKFITAEQNTLETPRADYLNVLATSGSIHHIATSHHSLKGRS